MTSSQALRVFLLLTVTRWLPTGFVLTAFTLIALERGLTVGQVGAFMALQGVIVFLLELPTSGLADTIGRKPVLLAASVFNILAGLVYAGAHSFWGFASAAMLMGAYRALDSGPLEAWYVDTLHESSPGLDPDRAMARQGTVAGLTMAVASLGSGALIAWHPFSDASALLLPIQVYVVLSVAHAVLVAMLMKEPPGRSRRSVDVPAFRLSAAFGETARVVRDGIRLLRTNRVLRGIVLVAVFWAFPTVVVEILQPVRFAELLGSQAASGAWMGPVAAVGWGVFAAGSAVAGVGFKRIGAARTAILARVLNGAGAVIMGLMLGPVALVGAYLLTYGLHGSGEAAHATVLHREASSANRSTVLSLSSMTFFVATSVALYLVGALAESVSTQVAMVVAGALSIVGFVFYLPALRKERDAVATRVMSAE